MSQPSLSAIAISLDSLVSRTGQIIRELENNDITWNERMRLHAASYIDYLQHYNAIKFCVSQIPASGDMVAIHERLLFLPELTVQDFEINTGSEGLLSQVLEFIGLELATYVTGKNKLVRLLEKLKDAERILNSILFLLNAKRK